MKMEIGLAGKAQVAAERRQSFVAVGEQALGLFQFAAHDECTLLYGAEEY